MVLVAVRFANEKVEIRFVLNTKNTVLGAHCESRRVASGRWAVSTGNVSREEPGGVHCNPKSYNLASQGTVCWRNAKKRK